LGLGTKYLWKKTEVGILIPINWFDSCNDGCFAGMKLTLHKSQVHCYRLCSGELAVQSCPLLCLQRRSRKSRADYSTVSLYCVAITWQQICKSSLYITVAGVLLHETVERTRLGR